MVGGCPVYSFCIVGCKSLIRICILREGPLTLLGSAKVTTTLQNRISPDFLNMAWRLTLSIESVEILSKHIPYFTQILKKEKRIKNYSIQIYLSLFTTFIFFLNLLSMAINIIN